MEAKKQCFFLVGSGDGTDCKLHFGTLTSDWSEVQVSQAKIAADSPMRATWTYEVSTLSGLAWLLSEAEKGSKVLSVSFARKHDGNPLKIRELNRDSAAHINFEKERQRVIEDANAEAAEFLRQHD